MDDYFDQFVAAENDEVKLSPFEMLIKKRCQELERENLILKDQVENQKKQIENLSDSLHRARRETANIKMQQGYGSGWRQK